MKAIVYIVIQIVQLTHPPVIGVYRTKEIAERNSADGIVYLINDTTDEILKGSKWKAFDDRDFIYDRLLDVCRGRSY